MIGNPRPHEVREGEAAAAPAPPAPPGLQIISAPVPELPLTSGDLFRIRLTKAIAENPQTDLTYHHGKGERRPVTVDVLVETMEAVRVCPNGVRVIASTYVRRGKRRNRWRKKEVGLSINRLARHLRCRRSKACRCLQILQELKLIAKTRNYCVGLRGNEYRILDDGEVPPPPPPTRRMNPGLPSIPQPGEFDDPF